MKAAIFRRPHEPLSIESVTVDKPQDREVLVRTAATGVCHSDLHYVDGDLPGRSHGGSRTELRWGLTIIRAKSSAKPAR